MERARQVIIDGHVMAQIVIPVWIGILKMSMEVGEVQGSELLFETSVHG